MFTKKNKDKLRLQNTNLGQAMFAKQTNVYKTKVLQMRYVYKTKTK